ncbi:MAG: glycoside hydrolase family 2, partial [Clostridia bacterium]|nr:glycoside hydrolase family 2 [Clostridia bacterium]
MEQNTWQDTYPRPRLRREPYVLLNGPWDFALTQGEMPTEYSRSINLPFAMEAPLSGVGARHKKGDILWYRRAFRLPESFWGKRVLLHCGGIDQHGAVYLNRKPAGMLSFLSPTLELTELSEGENTLIIAVTDSAKDKAWPYGKQKEKRGGMWYTPVTGIWQTVWLEAVPQRYVQDIVVTPQESGVKIEAKGVDAGTITLSDGAAYPLVDGEAVVVPENPIYWTPENPHLYDFTLKTAEDCVRSYFALRDIGIREKRLCLNGKPYFFHGLLDQGYWADGLYTPPDPSGYDRDILAMKELGFNTLRKHIKVEPELFYYACDRLGMAVFQDMVNNGGYSFLR